MLIPTEFDAQVAILERVSFVSFAVKAREVAITEEAWLERALRFGKAFVGCFRKEDVTPFIHIFVYHYGFFMAYNGIEKFVFFSNFANEGHHRQNRLVLAFGSSGFRYGETNAAFEQIRASVRRELHERKGNKQREFEDL